MQRLFVKVLPVTTPIATIERNLLGSYYKYNSLRINIDI